MSMKKLLALLLALVLVFSLVACGSSSSSSKYDDNDKGSSNADKNDKKDDDDDEKKPAKVSDAETVVGTWTYRAEFSDTYLELMKTQTGVSTLSCEEEVYLDLTVEFADGKLIIKGDMDEDSFTKFMIDITIEACYAATAAQGADKATTDAAFQKQYGMTVEQYCDNQVKLQLAQQQDELHMKTDAKYYKVDETAGKIYLAETEEGLAETKEAIDYSIENGKLTIKKFYDDKGEEMEEPLDLGEVGVNLPWTFEKK